jgi:putative addiction module component (TIGR02574 family)
VSHHVAQLIKDALSLPDSERIILVEQLLASLESDASKAIDALWAEESEDRLEAFKRGEIPTVAAEGLFDEVREP